MKSKWIIGVAIVLMGWAVLNISAGQLEPPGAVAPTMHGLGEIGSLGDATSLLAFDNQLGGIADLRSSTYVKITVNDTLLDTDVIDLDHGGQYDQWNRVIGVDYRVTQPYDPDSLIVTGQRQHNPLVVRMNLEKNWPLIYRAVTNDETLNEALLEWTRPDLPAPYYSIRLTNGKIVKAETIVIPTSTGFAHILEVTFVFGNIEVTWLSNGAASVSDSWAGTGS